MDWRIEGRMTIIWTDRQTDGGRMERWSDKKKAYRLKYGLPVIPVSLSLSNIKIKYMNMETLVHLRKHIHTMNRT